MANPFKSTGRRLRSWFAAPQQRPMRQQQKRCRPQLEVLEERALLSGTAVPPIGDVFYIEMENHNLTQPSGLIGSPEQLLGNPAAAYLNSLMTPGNPNAAQTSYASNYYNVEYNNPLVSIHPSEPNYIWQEAGLAGPLNDADPYAHTPNNIVNAPNLSALLQAAGIPWKSYQEDIDLVPSSGTVNQPGANSLTSTVAPRSQWTVPLQSFNGTSVDYANAYNGSHQYNFAAKHDGQLFFTATNGSSSTTPNFSPSNPETKYYAPLQQLQTDLDHNKVAKYNLISPDQYNDMHSSLNTNFTYNGVTYTHNTDQESIALGDNFLSKIVPQIMASRAYKDNGAIVIWYDETEDGNTTQFTIPEIVISPLAKGNAYESTLAYTHSSDLKSMQELFGVSAPGGGFLGDANTPGTNDLWDFFLPPAGATLQGHTLYLVGGNTNDQLDVTPIGSSQTGSTGINVDGTLHGVGLNQNFTGVNLIYVVVFNGNDHFQFASSLTIATVLRDGDGNDRIQLSDGNNTVNLGNGNDRVEAGDGTNIVNLGDGNDHVQLGDGKNTVRAGTGNELIEAGDGTNTITAGAPGSTGNILVQLGDGAGNIVTLYGNGNDQVRAGDGAGNTVSITGNGNDHVKLGDGNHDSVTIIGDGNDHLQLGDGNNDSVSITGDGNDQILVGDGLNDSVSMAGNGNDDIRTGDGTGTVNVTGSGHKTVHLGSSGWTLI